MEAKIAQENLIFSEERLQTLEKAKEQKVAEGEIENEHPGYLGTQDTFHVGHIKDVGRIYQQTFIDTYCKVAFAKLYDRKHTLVAANLPKEEVIPFFDEYEIPSC